MSLLAISKIRELRKQDGGDPRRPIDRFCFILNSLKHPGEVDTLREVYGEAFVAVSVYTPKAQRKETLSEIMARSRRTFDTEEFETKADELIDHDEKAAGDDFGQNVRDTFPLADVFLDASVQTAVAAQVKRFIEILFQHPNRTPTVDEYGLFHAKAAALRSSDLSRQVGAVIASKRGEILAAGCNEVPASGGAAYWEGQTNGSEDRRDFRIGYDSTARVKRELLREVFIHLQKNEWLSDRLRNLSPDELIEKALFDAENPVLSGTRIASLLEFGRVVHAEMSAITEAARRGVSIQGATLYCTTFPCHMCARHILAAGIQRVIYVEPYPKSMAKYLYKGLLDVDHDPEADADAVKFRPFVGISPKRYIDFFEMPARKDEQGFALAWIATSSTPRIRPFDRYLDAEAVLVERLMTRGPEWGIVEAKESRT